MSESAVMTILFSTRVSEDPLFTTCKGKKKYIWEALKVNTKLKRTRERSEVLTFEMWVVVVVTEVPLVVSEVMLLELDTVVQSLSSSVPSTVTWEIKRRIGWIIFFFFFSAVSFKRFRRGRCSAASCTVWSLWPGPPRPVHFHLLLLHANLTAYSWDRSGLNICWSPLPLRTHRWRSSSGR